MRVHPEMNLAIILCIALAAVVAAVSLGPIPQDPAYHRFADQRVLLSVPNFWNIITNIPFLAVGVMGMLLIARGKATGALPELRLIYFSFFLGLLGAALGSAWYHFDPTNQTLLWDRIPMALSFAAFFSAVLGEQVSTGAGRKMFLPLAALGVVSVLFWYASEKSGAGDLRLYALVQYLPVLLIPLLLILYKPGLVPVAYLWAVIWCYLAAKAAETLDLAVYETVRLLSGHSVKHLLAAAGAYVYYLALRRRGVR